MIGCGASGGRPLLSFSAASPSIPDQDLDLFSVKKNLYPSWSLLSWYQLANDSTVCFVCLPSPPSPHHNPIPLSSSSSSLSFLPLTNGLPIPSGFTLKEVQGAYPCLFLRWETVVSLTN